MLLSAEAVSLARIAPRYAYQDDDEAAAGGGGVRREDGWKENRDIRAINCIYRM